MWDTTALYMLECRLSYIIPNFYNWENTKYTVQGNYILTLKLTSSTDDLSFCSEIDVNSCMAGVCDKK